MAADRKGVGIRVGLEGEEAVKRGFAELAADGDRMFQRWGAGSKTASVELDGLGKGAQAAGAGLGDAAGAAGLAARGIGLATLASVAATGVLAGLTAAVL